MFEPIPQTPTSQEIAQRRFALVSRGFDPAEVLEFMNEIALRMQAIERFFQDDNRHASVIRDDE